MVDLPKLIHQTVECHTRLKMAKHKGQKPALVVLPKICQLFYHQDCKKPPSERFYHYLGIPVLFSDEPQDHNGFVVMKCDLTQEQRNYLKSYPQ